MINAFIHDGKGKIFNDPEYSFMMAMVRFLIILSIQC